MGKLKKLSKSDSISYHETEVFDFNSKTGETLWLWACQHGCYDSTPYDKTSYSEAQRLANNHSSVPRDN